MHIYNGSPLQLYSFFTTIKCYFIQYHVIVFFPGVYLYSADKKKADSLLLQFLILICRLLNFVAMIVITST